MMHLIKFGPVEIIFIMSHNLLILYVVISLLQWLLRLNKLCQFFSKFWNQTHRKQWSENRCYFLFVSDVHRHFWAAVCSGNSPKPIVHSVVGCFWPALRSDQRNWCHRTANFISNLDKKKNSARLSFCAPLSKTAASYWHTTWAVSLISHVLFVIATISTYKAAQLQLNYSRT